MYLGLSMTRCWIARDAKPTRLAALTALLVLLAFAFSYRALAAEALNSDWQSEWNQLLVAAAKEGQVSVYGPPGIRYQNAISAFQNAFPKIKLVYNPGSGSNNSHRLVTERRAGKYLADLFIGGSGTLIEVLFKGNLLEPLGPLLLLPEVKDPSVWLGKTHTFADAKGRYVFMMQGNVGTNLATYNTKLVNPEGLKSFLDLLDPKWKGKMVVYDPRRRGHVQSVRSLYYAPKLGGEFFRRFFGEMDVTVSREQRRMIDWVAEGKFLLSIFSTSTDVMEAKRQGLPVDIIRAPDDESYMSGGFGFVGVVDKAPHPAAAKVLLNWLLSKDGQLQWQVKTDNNSLRTDIPKNMLTDPVSIPAETGRYINTSLPRYQNIDGALKIINEALAKEGKR